MHDVAKVRVALLALRRNRLWLRGAAVVGTTAGFVATFLNDRS
jgi:hypothetical protein